MDNNTPNNDIEGDESKITTTTDNAKADIPKTGPAKVAVPNGQLKEATLKEESPNEEKEKETSSEKGSTNDDSSEKDDSKKMNMTEDEHGKIDHSKLDHSKMNMTKEEHSKMDHSKMDHGAIPMGMAGHDHHKMMIRDFKKRFWVSLIITIPILIFSPMIQDFFGYSLLLPGNQYILLALSSFVYFWGGWPFLKGFAEEIKERSPGMMTLIAMAISVAYFYSAATVFGLPGVDFFWELGTLIVIMLVGHWIEMKSVLGASKALQLLVSMMPAEAHRVKADGQIEDVNLDVLAINDVIMIKPGDPKTVAAL
jgi:Cu2+-exporting ATPase